jgi:hypothetical protein
MSIRPSPFIQSSVQFVRKNTLKTDVPGRKIPFLIPFERIGSGAWTMLRLEFESKDLALDFPQGRAKDVVQYPFDE